LNSKESFLKIKKIICYLLKKLVYIDLKIGIIMKDYHIDVEKFNSIVKNRQEVV